MGRRRKDLGDVKLPHAYQKPEPVTTTNPRRGKL